MGRVKEIDLEQMTALRSASQKFSQVLHNTMMGHLKTLTPLFAPRKVLGEFMESAFKEKIMGAEKNFTQLEGRYKTLCKDTFGIPSKLSTPISNINNQLELYPWEYIYRMGEDGSQTVSITSPVSWVLAYTGRYNLSNLLADHLQGEKVGYDDLKSLILNSLTLWLVVERSPGLKKLFEDLRFPMSIETTQIAGDLPFVVITSPLSSFCPQDALIQTVTQLSGRPVFEEFIDVEELNSLEDPFKGLLTEHM
ncbi:MAG: hypothetical protein GY703_13115 [Gammaproteobacteria bacterium]|nr:hypothetical protein [Gammaproteobacteria bacterium]